jgi:Domain of unknown function (DUF1996)
MSHRHDFFGNTGTNAFSTVATMSSAGTTCGTAADTAGYWSPSVLVHGSLLKPNSTRQELYYRYRYAPGVHIETMPTDLRVIAGNAMATSVASNSALSTGNLFWYCDGVTSKHFTLPPSCGHGTIVENVSFPSCWDGVLTHVNDSAHLVYAPDFGHCPAAFPHALPRISFRVKYVVGTNGAAVSLSSGAAYTAHADFWNTWQPAGLQYLVTHCLNAQITCGTNPVASAR